MKARKPADPAAKLAIWRAAREKVTAADQLNAEDMAKALAMGWRNLKIIIEGDPEFPILQRGSEGRPYRFAAAVVLDHMIAKAEVLVSERQARAARLARLSGATATASSPDPAVNQAAAPSAEAPAGLVTSAREAKALAEAQVALHRLKREQGQYMRADAVRAFVVDYNTTFQVETLAASSRIDPAGTLPAPVRAALDEELRNVLLTLQSKVDTWLKAHGNGAAELDA